MEAPDLIKLEPNPNIEEFKPGDTVRVSARVDRGQQNENPGIRRGRNTQQGKRPRSLFHRPQGNPTRLALSEPSCGTPRTWRA